MAARNSSDNRTPDGRGPVDKASVVVKVDFRQRRGWQLDQWLHYWPAMLVGSLVLMMLTLGALYTLTISRQHQLQTLTTDNRQLVENNRQLESRLLHGQSFHQLHAELSHAPQFAPANEKLLVKFPKAACHLTTNATDHLAPTQSLALGRVYGY